MPKMGVCEVYRDNTGRWRLRLIAGNGTVVGDGGQSYTRRWSAKRAARRNYPTYRTVVVK